MSFGLPSDKFPPFTAMGSWAGDYDGIPVYYGAPDFVSALIGTNTLAPGKACDRAGTSEGLNVCVTDEELPIGDESLRVLPSVMAGLWNVSYLIGDTGVSVDEYLGELGEGVERLKRATGRQNLEFVIAGGHGENTALCKLKARHTGATFIKTQVSNAELLGNAIIAFTALGKFGTLTDAAERIVHNLVRFD